jgi:hypothetical protein
VKTFGFLLNDGGGEQQTVGGTLLTFLQSWKKKISEQHKKLEISNN